MKLSIYLLATALITGCGATVTEEQPSNVVVQNELLVMIAADADIEVLKAAWQIFDPQVQLLGPREDGVLKVTLNNDVNIQHAQCTIKETKGVEAAGLNYIGDSVPTER